MRVSTMPLSRVGTLASTMGGPPSGTGRDDTVVSAEAMLLAGFGSVGVPVTVTELASWPTVPAVTTRVMVALPFRAMPPRLQVSRLPLTVHEPWLVVAET